MPQKPFNLDNALDDFRNDSPSPRARLRARNAFSRQPHRKPWKLAAVAFGVTLLVLPIFLRTEGSSALAITVGQAVQATKGAPYVIQIMDKVDARGRVLDHSESIWAPGRQTERLFFHNGVPGLESRHTHTVIFERHLPEKKSGRDDWKPFEIVAKTHAPIIGTEGGYFFEAQTSLIQNIISLKPERTEGPYAWFRLSPQVTWKVEVATKRIVRMENRSDGATFINVLTYPEHVDADRLDVPPIGSLPRFDLDREKAEMARLYRQGDRTAVVDGHKIKLVGVFQEVTAPGQPLFAAFQGQGIARITGFKSGASTTMKTTAPIVVATVFPTTKEIQSVDVEIPVPGTKRYVSFKNVRVRPVSDRIRSGLRVPAIK